MWKITLKSCAVMVLASMMIACGKDEPDVNPSGGGSDTPIVGPNENAADPAGTVALSMRNENSGKTYLDNIYIDKGDNFAGGDFVSLGTVKGLGNVSYIPKSGYASKVAVNRGNGYVAYAGGRYYRMYVTDYILDVASQILGAEVKYQKPFYGVDEPLRVDETALTFTNDGGSQSVVFNNSTIIPFTIQSSALWCRVYASSTTDSYFLHDAVTIEVEPTSSAMSEEATVTLTTGYKKELAIKVVRAGSEPYVSMGSNSAEIGFAAQTVDVGVSTNLMSELNVSCDADWCTAAISDRTSRMLEKAAMVKYIDGKPALTSRAYGDGVSSFNLAITATQNLSESQRTATITLTAGSAKATYTLVQNGTGLTILGLTDNQASISAEVWSRASLELETGISLDDLKVEYDVDWLKSEMQWDRTGKKWLYLTATSSNDNTVSRQAKVTVSSTGGELAASFTLIQEAATLEFVTEDEYISIPSTAGTQTIKLNTTVSSPNLQVESSEEWCKATIDGRAVQLDFLANPTSNPREATLKVSSSEGNIEQSITVKQEDGYIRFVDEKLEIDAFGGKRGLAIETNLDMSTFDVSANCDWASVTKTEKGVSVTIEPNKTLIQREGSISVSAPDNTISANLSLIQSKAILKIGQFILGENENVYNAFFSKEALTYNYTITTTLDWEVESDAAWCQVYKSGNSLALMVNAATENRKATVSFKDLPFAIEVTQVKYAYGDTYNENGVIGTICSLQLQYGIIYRLLGDKAWAAQSASHMLTGADSRTDGLANMEVIKRIPNWRNLFPAFAACDALNASAATEWYIPSTGEAESFLWFVCVNDPRSDFWSSTELYSADAYAFGMDNYQRIETISYAKTLSKKVIAIRKIQYDF